MADHVFALIERMGRPRLVDEESAGVWCIHISDESGQKDGWLLHPNEMMAEIMAAMKARLLPSADESATSFVMAVKGWLQ